MRTLEVEIFNTRFTIRELREREPIYRPSPRRSTPASSSCTKLPRRDLSVASRDHGGIPVRRRGQATGRGRKKTEQGSRSS